MAGAIKVFWNWATKWFHRYESFDFVTNKFGLTTIATKALPLAGALLMAVLTYIGHAPLYIILLTALCAVVLILATIRLIQIILKPDIRPSNEKIQPTGRKTSLQRTANQQQSNIGGFLAIAASVIIAIVGTNLYNNWNAYKEKLDQATLVVIPIPYPPAPDHNLHFRVDLHWADSGPLTIRGVRREHHFEYTKKELSNAEIDRQYPPLSAAIGEQEIPLLDELRPGTPGEFRTLSDERFTDTDWNNVLNGSLFVYMFVTFRYLVDDTSKDTEICLFITNDYPSVHKCLQHNQTLVSKS